MREGAADGQADARSAKDVLATLPGGCLLDAQGVTSGIREFERLSEQGCRAMDDGNFAGASGIGHHDRRHGGRSSRTPAAVNRSPHSHRILEQAEPGEPMRSRHWEMTYPEATISSTHPSGIKSWLTTTSLEKAFREISSTASGYACTTPWGGRLVTAWL
ncbi:hypothetical protein ABZT17_02700 [Streptomyces sp. NPDC005648]|uniref:hypothetical protein n=1 Tax=Streptomyces sp. NPDC005648 TaxID=3157044 RepID=UPI0033A0A80A